MTPPSRQQYVTNAKQHTVLSNIGSLFSGMQIATKALATHKLRTALAMLGVFLGALALTGVLHVSKAMTEKARLETAKLGPNLFAAIGGESRFRRSGTVRFGKMPTFTMQDAKALQNGMPQADSSAPFFQRTMTVKYKNTKVSTLLTATTPSYTHVRSFRPELGRFITKSDIEQRAKVIMLGKTIATKLFGTPEKALGKSVFLYKAQLTVVGVMESKGQDLSGANQDEQTFVPLSTYMRRLDNVDFLTGVYITLAKGADETTAKQTAAKILRNAHKLRGNQPDDFFVLTASDASKLRTQALQLVQTLGVLSSTISFLVGSLGILSIMILLVRARRLEIGIRRAVGARRRTIMGQFLLEAAIMSGIGGTLGVLSALGLVTIVYAVGSFPYVYDSLLIITACCASVFLGLIAGAYPAWQASKVEVLNVLRNS